MSQGFNALRDEGRTGGVNIHANRIQYEDSAGVVSDYIPSELTQSEEDWDRLIRFYALINLDISDNPLEYRGMVAQDAINHYVNKRVPTTGDALEDIFVRSQWWQNL